MLAVIRSGLLLLCGVLLMAGSSVLYVLEPETLPTATAAALPSQRASVRPTNSEKALSPTPAPSVPPEPSESLTEPVPLPTAPLGDSGAPQPTELPTVQPLPTVLPSLTVPTVEPTPCIVIPGVTICFDLLPTEVRPWHSDEASGLPALPSPSALPMPR